METTTLRISKVTLTMKIIYIMFFQLLVAPALAQSSEPEMNKSPLCSANFVTGISAREYEGEHTIDADLETLSLGLNGRGLFDRMGLSTCMADKEWHCIDGVGFSLYLPRGRDIDHLSQGKFRYIKNQRELILFNKKQLIYTVTAYPLDSIPVEGTLEPQGIYLFNKKMDLIGFSLKMSIDVETHASTFITFYVHDGRLPSSCY